MESAVRAAVFFCGQSEEGAAPEASDEREDDFPIGLGLFDPGIRYVQGARGTDDALVGGVIGVAGGAVSGDHADGQACSAKGPPRVLGDFLIHFDRCHPSGGDLLCDQRGVVAGAGTDLQDVHARLHVEEIEHQGHDVQSAGRAGGDQALAVL